MGMSMSETTAALDVAGVELIRKKLRLISAFALANQPGSSTLRDIKADDCEAMALPSYV